MSHPSRGTQSGSSRVNTRVFSVQRLPPRFPRGSRVVQLHVVAHDVAVARCNGYPENSATCAPHPGVVTGRAHLICAINGLTSPINRPRGIPVLHCAIVFSLSLALFSTHSALREEHRLRRRTPSPEQTRDAQRRRPPEITRRRRSLHR